MALNSLGISLAPMLRKHAPGLANSLGGFGKWYAEAAGWRRMGLKFDDLGSSAILFVFSPLVAHIFFLSYGRDRSNATCAYFYLYAQLQLT
jgi:hypothetical protein